MLFVNDEWFWIIFDCRVFFEGNILDCVVEIGEMCFDEVIGECDDVCGVVLFC